MIYDKFKAETEINDSRRTLPTTTQNREPSESTLVSSAQQ